jgi:tetratricopeptide (TPR) repeat protein
MPSHIYSMLGMWEDSIASNLAAEATGLDQAARDFPGKAHPGLPHWKDFRAYAYLQVGQDRLAKLLADDMNNIDLPKGAYLTSGSGRQAIPARYALDRGRWDEAARLDVYPSDYPQVMAIGYFARGIGAARGGDVAAARTEITRLEAVKAELSQAHDEYWAGQTQIQLQALGAWVGFTEGQHDAALAAMRAAADLDDASEKHVAMENKLLPIRALLGELYLAVGMNVEALGAFEASLKVVPNRARSLLGAAQAARGAGSEEVAKQYYRALVGLLVNGDGDRPELAEAKSYLAAN